MRFAIRTVRPIVASRKTASNSSSARRMRTSTSSEEACAPTPIMVLIVSPIGSPMRALLGTGNRASGARSNATGSLTHRSYHVYMPDERAQVGCRQALRPRLGWPCRRPHSPCFRKRSERRQDRAVGLVDGLSRLPRGAPGCATPRPGLVTSERSGCGQRRRGSRRRTKGDGCIQEDGPDGHSERAMPCVHQVPGGQEEKEHGRRHRRQRHPIRKPSQKHVCDRQGTPEEAARLPSRPVQPDLHRRSVAGPSGTGHRRTGFSPRDSRQDRLGVAFSPTLFVRGCRVRWDAISRPRGLTGAGLLPVGCPRPSNMPLTRWS